MTRGHLRIYLGAAPGVGKTYAMLDEGNRRRARGTDVVIAVVDTRERVQTEAMMGDLPVVPTRRRVRDGVEIEELDLPAVLARAPAVALVDDLASTNAPGAEHEKRWQDVESLLDAGIDVIATVNIEHLESLNDVVERITGVHQDDTVPDAVVRAADQVELVDMSPEALRRRLAHGNVYPADRVDAALSNYFREGNLGALRELALLWVADKVDDALQDQLDARGISGSWETRERVVVAVTGAPSGEHVIRRAARMAQRARGELVGVHVSATDTPTTTGTTGENTLDRHRQLLTDLGGKYHELVGGDIARSLVEFARTERATQLVLGATGRSRWKELMSGSVINTVIRNAGEIDVHVIRSPSPNEPTTGLAGPPTRTPISSRRQRAGWALTLLGIPLLTFALTRLPGHLNLTSVALMFLLLVTVVAVVAGSRPSIVAAVAASLALNWFFTEPLHTFTIAQRDNLLAFFVFLAVAALVSTVVSEAGRRSADVARARAEAEALARIAGGLLGEDDPVREMVSRLRSTFSLDAAAVLAPDPPGWAIVEALGTPLPTDPRDGESVPLADGAVLVIRGRTLTADDRRVLHVFAAQLSAALERRRLRRAAAEASALAEADHLRTAILRAVSHDLRTPLAAIKASVTSLLPGDVEWSDAARTELLRTIDEETDRLDDLVGNLLDMSRIETGALEVRRVPIGIEEVVARSLASISASTGRVDVAVSERLPRVLTDAALVERAVANLVANALAFAPADERVRIEAGTVGDRIHLRIVDRGPGVAPRWRDHVFEPFQRLGDHAAPTGSANGIGLGLAVARGFVDAVGGRLVLEDTPGGGLTAVLELPLAPADGASTADRPAPDKPAPDRPAPDTPAQDRAAPDTAAGEVPAGDDDRSRDCSDTAGRRDAAGESDRPGTDPGPATAPRVAELGR